MTKQKERESSLPGFLDKSCDRREFIRLFYKWVLGLLLASTIPGCGPGGPPEPYIESGGLDEQVLNPPNLTEEELRERIINNPENCWEEAQKIIEQNQISFEQLAHVCGLVAKESITTQEQKQIADLLKRNSNIIAANSALLLARIKANQGIEQLVLQKDGSRQAVDIFGKEVQKVEDLGLLDEQGRFTENLSGLLAGHPLHSLNIARNDQELKSTLAIIRDIIAHSRLQSELYSWMLDLHPDWEEAASTSIYNTLVLAQLLEQNLERWNTGGESSAYQIWARDVIVHCLNMIGALNEGFLQNWRETESLSNYLEEELISGAEKVETKSDWEVFLGRKTEAGYTGKFFLLVMEYLTQKYKLKQGVQFNDMYYRLRDAVKKQIEILKKEAKVDHRPVVPDIIADAEIELIGEQNLKIKLGSEREDVSFAETEVLKFVDQDGKTLNVNLQEVDFTLGDILNLKALGIGAGKTLSSAAVDRLVVVKKGDQYHLALRLKNVFEWAGNFEFEKYDSALVPLSWKGEIEGLKITPVKDQKPVLFEAERQSMPTGWQEVSFWSEDKELLIGSNFTPEEAVEAVLQLYTDPWDSSRLTLAPSMGSLIRQEGKVYDFYQQAEVVGDNVHLYKLELDPFGVNNALKTEERLPRGSSVPIFTSGGVKETGWRRLIPGNQGVIGGPDGAYVLLEQIAESSYLAVRLDQVEVTNEFDFGPWWANAKKPLAEVAGLGALPFGGRMGGTIIDPKKNIDQETKIAIEVYTEMAEEIVEAYEEGSGIITNDMLRGDYRVTRQQYRWAQEMLQLSASLEPHKVTLPMPRVGFSVLHERDIKSLGSNMPERILTGGLFIIWGGFVLGVYDRLQRPKTNFSPLVRTGYYNQLSFSEAQQDPNVEVHFTDS